MISVLVLTLNEEKNIGPCLDSVQWSDDVVVFDSFSRDKTCSIARDKGARVIQHRFENYGAQREAARLQGNFKHPWVLVLDADETPDPELVAELQALAAGPEGQGPDAYRMRRKDYFQGRWVRHATLYPSWFVRFFRWKEVHYQPRSVHEYPSVHGPLGEVKGHLIHNSFSKGLGEWWAKHVRYADLEAREGLESMERPLNLRGLLSPDPVLRRRSLKDLACRLPLRPVFRFLYGYVWHGGILDGRPGLDYCLMLACYEFMIVGQLREMKREKALLKLALPDSREAALPAKRPTSES